MYSHFSNGVVSGFAVSTIISPRLISCIRRSVVKGFKAGVFTGLGAAIADVTFAAIAAFGMFGISVFLIKNAIFFGLACGLYLIYIGYQTFSRKPETSKRCLKRIDFLHILMSTFLVTISNPMSILSFVVIFTGLGVHPENFFCGVFLILGIFVGSLTWWVMLSAFGALLKNKLASDKVIIMVNRISSIIIAFFGLSMIFRALIKLYYK